MYIYIHLILKPHSCFIYPAVLNLSLTKGSSPLMQSIDTDEADASFGFFIPSQQNRTRKECTLVKNPPVHYTPILVSFIVYFFLLLSPSHFYVPFFSISFTFFYSIFTTLFPRYTRFSLCLAFFPQCT